MNTLNELYDVFAECGKVSTDTRSDVKNSLFFALSGDNFDGNAFAKDALIKGARIAVIDNPVYHQQGKTFLVDNVLETLQKLAGLHISKSGVPVLAITGTNGKTTTKELVSAVLSSEKKILSTPGNLNNHIGVPLTLLSVKKEHEIAVVEMGANHKGEIKQLCNIATPQYGIITNIGKAHIEGFGNLQGVIDTKNELYQAVKTSNGTVFVNGDDKLLMKLSSGINRFVYGRDNGDVTGKITETKPFLELVWNNNGKKITVSSHLYGSYNFNNIMAAIAVGKYFGISEQSIVSAIQNYIPSNNRSQILKTGNNTVILDAYNANPESMKAAITDFYNNHFDNPVLILGDMFELGNVSKEEHQKIVDLIDNYGFDDVFLAGVEFFNCKTPDKFHRFENTGKLLEELQKIDLKNKTVLVKGSRGMKMEKTVEYL
jgi:UDP-N-acetylmuramoyl-tripeptide--D-alanyl-D-alanine ligase